MNKILVVGASGNVGAPLAARLAAQGQSVLRATSKAQLASGQVHLNLASRQGYAEALDGVTHAFLLAPPGYVNQHELLNPLITEAGHRGVSKIVLMTAMGANADPSSPMRQAELHLEQSGLAYNIIRPNWFMQNFNSFWLQPIKAEGKILLPVGDAKGSFIDARDIAAVATQLLTTNQHDNQAFDLTGSQALDHNEVAAILSRAAGRTITYQDITPDAMLAALLEAKLPRAYAEFLILILSYFKAGHSQAITNSVKQITGHDPILFEQYAADHRTAWE